MTIDISNRNAPANHQDRRPAPLFPETNRGVQQAARAYEDRAGGTDERERSRALEIVIRSGLL